MMEKDFDPFRQFAGSGEDFVEAKNAAPAPGLRKFASVLFGFAYGGSLLNGIEDGLEFVLKDRDVYFLGQWPLAEAGVFVCCGVLAGLLGSYAAQSRITGAVASLLVSASALAVKTKFFQQPGDIDAWIMVTVIAVGGALAGYFYYTMPVREEEIREDLERGAVFGVSWVHWLWLWLPWQLIVTNGVWVAYPATLQLGVEVPILVLVKQILKAPASVALVAFGAYKAIESLRMDSGLTRVQSFMRFVGWVLLFPIAVNLLRLI